MIEYIERETGARKREKVYGEAALAYIYGPSASGRLLCFLVSRSAFFSRLYGFWQRMPWSRRKIIPFIREYGIDASEFLEKPSSFRSFNAFFVRKLRPAARPIGAAPLVMPADGRYFFYPDISRAEGFVVKGEKFSLAALLQDAALAEEFAGGTMVMARLCPSDYHRFHFPCAGVPKKARLINGPLYSVNPVAIRQNLQIYAENKRMVTEVESELFGKYLYLEIGATNVGSINQTYRTGVRYGKGAEKGYFAFGGSALILLFKPGRVRLKEDLQVGTQQGLEMLCLTGTDLGEQP